MAVAARLVIQKRINRTVWCKPVSRGWWEAVTNGLFGEEWWKENFRMTQDTFKMLCSYLHPYLVKKTTRSRNPISVEQRVAVTIWRLATNVELRTISTLFGLGQSTVGKIVNETCSAITTYLLNKFVRIPEGQRLDENIEGFEHRRGFPQAVGAIDGTHIPIICPEDSSTDYYNRKCFYSIIMQAVVDYQGLFIDVYIGWPGKVHDARVFVNSSFHKGMVNGTLFPRRNRVIKGVEVPLLILGDPAYPALPWLMKPYPEHASMTEEMKHYNYRQSRARIVVENAFGRLKGRWRCLMKRLNCQVSNVGNIVASCVVLHNICETFGDDCLPEWIDEYLAENQPSSVLSSSCGQDDGNAIRDVIARYLYSNR